MIYRSIACSEFRKLCLAEPVAFLSSLWTILEIPNSHLLPDLITKLHQHHLQAQQTLESSAWATRRLSATISTASCCESDSAMAGSSHTQTASRQRHCFVIVSSNTVLNCSKNKSIPLSAHMHDISQLYFIRPVTVVVQICSTSGAYQVCTVPLTIHMPQPEHTSIKVNGHAIT